MEIGNTQARNDINALLAQMRGMRLQAQRELNSATPAADVASPNGVAKLDKSSEFGELLKSAIDSVNTLQKTASQGRKDFVTGKETDLVKVMVDGQKASVGFQAMVQVRNRMVSAYQDIMKMPI